MNVLTSAWRWISGVVIACLVITYLGALLTHNLINLAGRDKAPKAADASLKLLTAAGTNQQWNMFAPNVGTISVSPVVVIVMTNGRRIALRSSVEPELDGWERTKLIPHDAGPEARRYRWMLHFGNGRIRKYESRAASTDPGWWRIRTTYARWRATKWLEENPEQRDNVERIELWRSTIRHPGYGRELCCESMQMIPITPQFDSRWPVRVDLSFPMYRQ